MREFSDSTASGAKGVDRGGAAPGPLNDVELIGHSYRALIDSSAFDDLVDAWNRRIGTVDSLHPAPLQFDDAMLAQFAEVERLAAGKTQALDNDPVEELLSHCVTAAMVQNCDGRVVAINPRGRAEFGLETGDSDDERWLAPAHVAAVRDLRARARVPANADRRVVECVDPNDAAGHHTMRLADARIVTLPDYPNALILVRSLEFAWQDGTSALVEQTWGLTEAESEIARLYYRHRSLQRVADARRVSIQTIQTQFKALLAKSGCGGQVELIRVLTALCIQTGIDAEIQTGEWINPYRNERRIVRAGGKRLAFSQAGPKNGRPLLWLHGPVFNFALPRAVLDSLDDLGVRLIAPCRPGYGHSEVDRSLSAEDDNIDALLTLAHELDLSACPAIGTTSAATMLILARDRAPDRFGRLGFISNFWKMTEDEVRKLTPIHRTFFRLATSAPPLLNYVTALALRLARRHGPAWYVERAHGYNPHNAQTLRSPETQALLRSDTRAMMLQNGRGFARDRMLVLSDAEPALARTVRDDIWLYGEHDSHIHGPPPSTWPQVPAAMAVECVSGASELLLYQRPDAVRDLIARLVG